MEIMIDSNLIKSLRLKRSWSQEKLANSTGLSLRTIQRVEAKGVASLETRLALANVFKISPEQLTNSSNSFGFNPKTIKNTSFNGYIGAGIGLVCSYLAITSALLQGGISFQQAGLWYGSVGCFIGVCCGVIGFLSKSKEQ